MNHPVRACVAVAAAIVLGACEHAQPFGAADLGPNVPFSTALPRQLTLSAAGDVTPAWLPDGSGIIYSFQRLDRSDHDRCLGILPAEGGQRVRTICHQSPLDADSTNALWSPAVGPGGVLAYVRESARIGLYAPQSRELVVASLQNPDHGRVVRTFPYITPDGQLHVSASHLQWVDAWTLVYVAEDVFYFTRTLPYDTVTSPLEIVRLSLAGDSVVMSVVPFTSNGSSVAVDSAGSIYFTRLFDSRVWRLVPGAPAPAVVYNFGTAGIARDVQVRGNVLVATVGGQLYRVDLTSLTAVGIPPVDSLIFAYAALSPAGTRVVAEAYGLTGGADLWLFQVP
jgi:hypothetical protein